MIVLDFGWMIIQVCGMELSEIISEVEEYAEKVGLSPSTICVRATGNSRLLDRIQRKADQIDIDTERLRAFMRDNPPTHKDGTAA